MSTTRAGTTYRQGMAEEQGVELDRSQEGVAAVSGISTAVQWFMQDRQRREAELENEQRRWEEEKRLREMELEQERRRYEEERLRREEQTQS